jgi:hypothetical protein
MYQYLLKCFHVHLVEHCCAIKIGCTHPPRFHSEGPWGKNLGESWFTFLHWLHRGMVTQSIVDNFFGSKVGWVGFMDYNNVFGILNNV